MKIWNSHGSEHSSNLVMVGKFKDVESAENAKALIDKITDFVSSSDDDFENADRYSESAMKFLEKISFYSVGPSELGQFRLDVQPKLKADTIVITTDEIEVSAFLKLLFNKGAKIEVYSAHDYPGTGEGRQTASE